MKFMQRLKSDKKFRFRVVAIVILILILYGNSGQKTIKKEVKQSTCNQANTRSGIKCDFDKLNVDAYNHIGSDICMPTTTFGNNPEEDMVILCKGNKCGIGRLVDTTGPDILDDFGCFSCVPGGLRVETITECCGTGIASNGPDSYDYICTTPDPEQECDTDTQQMLADIVDSVWDTNKLECKTKFYMVAVGGPLIVLMMMMALL